MGQPTILKDVKLFMATTFSNQKVYAEVRQILEEKFGQIDFQSDIFDFNFTEYYAPEMGINLRKQFVSFQPLIKPENLNEIKLWTNELEMQYSVAGKRQVNIDPGYLTAANIVLATTKNFSHRVYLGKGIYGDVHLRFRNHQFQALEWTYADYRQPLAIGFFTELRKLYSKSEVRS